MLSAKNPELLDLVSKALASGNTLTVLKRLGNAGGMRTCFLIRSLDHFRSILNSSRSGDSLTVFLSDPFEFHGASDSEFERIALDYFSKQKQAGVDVFLIRTDRTDDFPSDWIQADEAEDLIDWLGENRGAPVAIGGMNFLRGHRDSAVTAYVPDPDGNVPPRVF